MTQCDCADWCACAMSAFPEVRAHVLLKQPWKACKTTTYQAYTTTNHNKDASNETTVSNRLLFQLEWQSRIKSFDPSLVHAMSPSQALDLWSEHNQFKDCKTPVRLYPSTVLISCFCLVFAWSKADDALWRTNHTSVLQHDCPLC